MRFNLALAVALAAVASSAQAALLVGVTTTNDLIEFDSTNPSQLTSSLPLTGLGQNEVIRGIDFRPIDQQLYAVGSSGNIYTVNRATGAATVKSTISGTVLNGSAFGIDFNPVADKSGASSLRVVSNTTQNLAVNADTGVATVATPVSYGGGPVNIVGEAYSNSIIGGVNGPLTPQTGTTGTTQYAIDSGTDGLVLQAFNAGTLTPIGSLGVNTTANVGFDILSIPGVGGISNIGYASLEVDGSPGKSILYEINLATGAALSLGQIDGGILVPNLTAELVIDPNSVIPEPSALGLAGLALAAVAFRSRNGRRA